MTGEGDPQERGSFHLPKGHVPLLSCAKPGVSGPCSSAAGREFRRDPPPYPGSPHPGVQALRGLWIQTVLQGAAGTGPLLACPLFCGVTVQTHTVRGSPPPGFPEGVRKCSVPRRARKRGRLAGCALGLGPISCGFDVAFSY